MYTYSSGCVAHMVSLLPNRFCRCPNLVGCPNCCCCLLGWLIITIIKGGEIVRCPVRLDRGIIMNIDIMIVIIIIIMY